MLSVSFMCILIQCMTADSASCSTLQPSIDIRRERTENLNSYQILFKLFQSNANLKA